MGLQPIDLQTMYSQISNAAKMAVNVEQSVALAQKAQQADSVRKNEELNTKVQKTGEEQKSSGVNQNGHNQNEMSGKNNKQKENDSKPDEEKDKYRLKESFLGQHIDITR